MPGNSLGRNQTGATAAGPVWAAYMKAIHKELKPKPFVVPQQGLVFREICADSGGLPTEGCSGTVEEVYLSGTEPRILDTYLAEKTEVDIKLVEKLKSRLQLGSGAISSLNLPFQGEKRLYPREEEQPTGAGNEKDERHPGGVRGHRCMIFDTW